MTASEVRFYRLKEEFVRQWWGFGVSTVLQELIEALEGFVTASIRD